ncbi:MAG: alpha/beta hydrolase, partial [Oscillospiraceae bacterium]|nr:alpha/beta hydrolase [Oscillospiraceae bacterium]
VESSDFPLSDRDLPICLFGHSWGGYCVSAVLSYHPEIKAVIECSGFDRSSDMFEAQGKLMAGDAIYLMLPFVKLHDRLHYGEYSLATASDGMAASDAAVMIVHSQDDTTVPIEYGYDRFYERFGGDPRFTFRHYDDKGHSNIFNARTYTDEFNKHFDEWMATLGYDPYAKENTDRFIKDKADYINNNLDRKRRADRLDKDMFEMFVGFYDENIG